MKQGKVRPPSKLDHLAVSTAQDFAHQHTVSINSRRRVLQFEVTEIDRAIVVLSAELANQRAQRARIEAILLGLTSVVEKR